MSRSSIVVRLARQIQRLPLSWLRWLEAPFVHLSRRARREPPMIILLALPRSGSTLTYQCLVHGLGATYLSNVWNMLFALPLVGATLSRLKCQGHDSDFRSEHGFVDGLCGPAEGLTFWSYWCGQGLADPGGSGEPEPRRERRVRYIKKVLALVATDRRPFVAGYLGHALVARDLATMFPNAIFVRLTRDPLHNALSILALRDRDASVEFSVTPAECRASPGESVHRQVARQVHFLNRRIDQGLVPDRTKQVSYEDLCRDPNGEVNRVVQFANAHGMRVGLQKKLPTSFHGGPADTLATDDARMLASELAMLAEPGIQKGC